MTEIDLYAPGTLTGRISPDGRDIILDAIGGDHQLQDMANSLKHATALPKIVKSKYDGKMHVPLTWAMVTQLARLMQVKGHQWKAEPDLSKWIREEFERRFTESGDLKFDLSSLDRTPMSHQASGAFVGAMNERFFFADDMGTGKTFTALLTLAELEAQGKDPFPAFVVCPAAVMDPWLEEIQECFPDWNVAEYSGSKRKNLSTRYQVYVMSWDVFRLDMFPKPKAECPKCETKFDWPKKLQKQFDDAVMGMSGVEAPKCGDCQEMLIPLDTEKTDLPPLIEFLVPRTIILDEAHALCNVKTKQSVAARRIARVARYAFPMSGTPITKDVNGFWSAMSVMDVRSFPSQERYRDRYTDSRKTEYGAPEIEGLTTTNRDEFYTMVQGSMRRIAKADVLTELPPKRYSVRYVDIPPAYRAAYEEMEEDMIAHIPDTDEPLPVMSTLAQLTRLSQLASSACDVQVEEKLEENEKSPNFGLVVPHYTVTAKDPSWKVDELMNIAYENEGSPLVVFSPSTQLVKLAGARAEKEGYKTGYIVGGQSKTQRTATRKAFQNGDLDLICCNTAAGGVGLTLTAADTLIFLSRPWSYVQAAQAEDRIHRRGQEQVANIIDIVARKTVEERVRTALKSKAQQLSDLVRDPRIVREILGGK